jgi:hypothetical protein
MPDDFVLTFATASGDAADWSFFSAATHVAAPKLSSSKITV